MQVAVAHYHELLTDELAQASEAMLTDQLRRRGLVFGDRPLATVIQDLLSILVYFAVGVALVAPDQP